MIADDVPDHHVLEPQRPIVLQLLPERVVRAYQQRFPKVELLADSGPTAVNIERLRAGELDVAFVLTPLEQAADLDCVEIATATFVVAVPRTHPLSRRRRIPRAALAGVPLVYFPRHLSPGLYDRSLVQVYGSAGAPTIVRTESPEERMLGAVAEGAGITVLPEERAATLRYPGVVYRRFADPVPTVALGVAFRRPPSLAARRFVALAQELGQPPELAGHPRREPTPR